MDFISVIILLSSSQLKSRNQNDKSSFLSSENKFVSAAKTRDRKSKDAGMKSYLKILRDKEIMGN
jgi:hypothetical protein